MRYFTDAGPVRGPLRHRDVPGAIGVFEALDDPALPAPDDPARPIGLALPVGWNAAGVALWELNVRGADLAGRWVVIDREFRPVQ